MKRLLPAEEEMKEKSSGLKLKLCLKAEGKKNEELKCEEKTEENGCRLRGRGRLGCQCLSMLISLTAEAVNV
jgi:hypothetical protein